MYFSIDAQFSFTISASPNCLNISNGTTIPASAQHMRM